MNEKILHFMTHTKQFPSQHALDQKHTSRKYANACCT